MKDTLTYMFGIGISLLISLLGCSLDDEANRSKDGLVRDNALILGDIAESLESQLYNIRDSYGIEVVLATIESTGKTETIDSVTTKLFSRWDVGRNFEGRGLLLLLAKEEKEVRIEVGLALEGIFTDLFTGYIEDKQLKPYFLSNQLSTGLIALVEEIEIRAALLTKGEISSEKIHAQDIKFLSAGGGAGVVLETYQPSSTVATDSKYPAGSTPEQAWQMLLQSWHDKNRNPNIGVYTPATRLIYRAFTNVPDRRFEEDILRWADKPYEIIQNKNFAVIYFGKEKGWENAPFLFSRTEEGWQFDMVHQRKIVRMGKAPFWGIERGEHPYIHLLSKCPYWMGQDIPLNIADIYDVRKDSITAHSIVSLEQKLQDEETLETLIELGRLYILTSMGQQRFTLLNKAHQQQRENPVAIKYLAIAHVDAHYQYNTALKLMNQYIHLLPADPFGHFFHGYLLMMVKRWDDAIVSLKAGLALEPTNVYGLCKLARVYHLRNNGGDKGQMDSILRELESLYPDHIRTQWLRQFLKN